MRRRGSIVVSAVCLFAGVLVAATAAAIGHRAFYLSVHARQCLVAAVGSGSAAYKTVLVVPCSDPAHDLEVYAVGHGGWGHQAPPATKTVLAIMRTVCLGFYRRMTGHALPSNLGWDGFAPDPGSETSRYGDKLVCSLRTWPGLHPLGAGWHVH